MDMASVVEDSSTRTPLIFVLSPGVVSHFMFPIQRVLLWPFLVNLNINNVLLELVLFTEKCCSYGERFTVNLSEALGGSGCAFLFFKITYQPRGKRDKLAMVRRFMQRRTFRGSVVCQIKSSNCCRECSDSARLLN